MVVLVIARKEMTSKQKKKLLNLAIIQEKQIKVELIEAGGIFGVSLTKVNYMFNFKSRIRGDYYYWQTLIYLNIHPKLIYILKRM